ncbi:zinc finger protein 26-like [Agrilus planipennis]|uniref:Zinc finger protein 26-like n=1 Tax=Agrilus planipennis TaxID=224129 RepID=A0A7F5QWX3_AGRPL|nr:zinc finger protein 26-like [Agrilus planipennis]
MSKKENGSSFQCAFEKAVQVMTTTDPNELKGRIECEVCKGIFFMRHHFNSHICNDKAKQISCPICQKTFTSRFRLRQHSYLHSGEKPVECKVCKKRFSLTYIAKHLQTHTGGKRFKCKICEKSYRYSDTLKAHMYSHTGEKPHKCKYCGRQFRVKSILRVHLTTHEEKTNKCLLCPRVFSTRYYLKVHMAVHENEKPFKCETCGKCFVLNITLKKHMLTHLGKKPFKCQQCSKTFTRKETLSVHVKCTHQKDTSGLEKCHVCNKHFLYKSRLGQHMRTHTKLDCLFCVRPAHECICLENSERHYSDSLKKPYMRDNFMFKCQTCSRIILRQSQLKMHLRKHREYKCVVCDKDYKNCSCSDSHIEVSKSKNTYQKSSKPSISVNNHSTDLRVVNPKDIVDPLNGRFATKDKFMLKCQTCSRIVLCQSQLKFHSRVHRDFKCVVCNEDYRNCSCSDDYLEVSKGVNTYQKTSKASTNAIESLTRKTVEPAVEVKEEETFTSIDTPGVKCENKSIELSEVTVAKEEPIEAIGENTVDAFAYSYCSKVDEVKNKTTEVKEEIVEL